jgi:hypothetical protein
MIDREEEARELEGVLEFRLLPLRSLPTEVIKGSEATSPAPRPREALLVLAERDAARAPGGVRSGDRSLADTEASGPELTASRPRGCSAAEPPESGSSAEPELLRPPARLSRPAIAVGCRVRSPEPLTTVSPLTMTVLSFRMLFETTTVAPHPPVHQFEPAHQFGLHDHDGAQFQQLEGHHVYG